VFHVSIWGAWSFDRRVKSTKAPAPLPCGDETEPTADKS